MVRVMFSVVYKLLALKIIVDQGQKRLRRLRRSVVLDRLDQSDRWPDHPPAQWRLGQALFWPPELTSGLLGLLQLKMNRSGTSHGACRSV